LNIVAARGATGKNQLTLPLFLCYNDLRGKLKMSVKIALLKSGESVIADIKELISEEKVCGYLFTNPHKMEVSNSLYLTEQQLGSEDGTVSVTFSSWIIFSSDNEILVRPDWIVTIVEPVESIKQMYEEKVNGTEREVSSIEG
jgi:hypothetical protein